MKKFQTELRSWSIITDKSSNFHNVMNQNTDGFKPFLLNG